MEGIKEEPKQWQELTLDGFICQTKCPSCSSSSSDILGGQGNVIFGRKFPAGAFRFGSDLRRARVLKQCLLCDLIYQKWIPSKELLLELYSTDIVSKPWTPDPRRLTWERAKKYLPAQSGRILDVGANDGHFLSLVPEDWKKFALEPTNSSKKSLSKIAENIYEGFLDDDSLQLPNNTFDVACLFDVAEHFHNVTAAMTNLWKCLREGGLVILETGYTDCLPARMQKSTWWYYDYIEHLVFFNKKSIRWALTKSGFKVECMKIVVHTSMGNSLIMGKDLLKKVLHSQKINSRLGVANEGEQIYLENPLRIYWPDHIFIVARKEKTNG